ncbi:hypothetical protein [Bacillus sp. H1a]|nr:hypothetical protein [Bacillus sp. H1a]
MKIGLKRLTGSHKRCKHLNNNGNPIRDISNAMAAYLATYSEK